MGCIIHDSKQAGFLNYDTELGADAQQAMADVSYRHKFNEHARDQPLARAAGHAPDDSRGWLSCWLPCRLPWTPNGPLGCSVTAKRIPNTSAKSEKKSVHKALGCGPQSWPN